MRSTILAPLVAAVLCLCAVPAFAQLGPTNAYTLKLYQVGATAPMQTTTAPSTAAVCNVAPATVSTVNPTAVEWDDPVNAGKACHLDLTAFFGGLPASTQFGATLTFTDDLGQSGPESAVSAPFTRRTAPGQLQHVRVVGGK